jgi:hypothetical protein
VEWIHVHCAMTDLHHPRYADQHMYYRRSPAACRFPHNMHSVQCANSREGGGRYRYATHLVDDHHLDSQVVRWCRSKTATSADRPLSRMQCMYARSVHSDATESSLCCCARGQSSQVFQPFSLICRCCRKQLSGGGDGFSRGKCCVPAIGADCQLQRDSRRWVCECTSGRALPRTRKATASNQPHAGGKAKSTNGRASLMGPT